MALAGGASDGMLPWDKYAQEIFDAQERPVQFRPMNPLCDAAEQGDLPKLTTLIAQRGDVNITGENGNSALAFACANGHADCTSLLLRHGAQVNQRSSLGNAPLHAACWADSSKCLRQLLDAKAEINLQSCSGSTPMHVAIQGGRSEAVETLIARGRRVRRARPSRRHRRKCRRPPSSQIRW